MKILFMSYCIDSFSHLKGHGHQYRNHDPLTMYINFQSIHFIVTTTCLLNVWMKNILAQYSMFCNKLFAFSHIHLQIPPSPKKILKY